MLKSLVSGIFAAALLLPASANAVVNCSGQVKIIEQRATSLVIADWGYGWKGLCYLNQDVTVNGVTTTKEACGSYYAALLTATATHQQISTVHNANDCPSALAETSSDQHWMAVPPYSLMIQAN